MPIKVTKIFALLLITIFPLIILLSNLKRFYYSCINANDFSIYQQAFYEIAAGVSWNPYISIRNLHILSDHIDPAIYLAALFVKIFGFNGYAIITFEWLWYVGVFAAIFFLGREFLFSALLIVFSRALLDGLEFPIHPTTWSMLPSLLLFYFIAQKKEAENLWWILACAFSLCLFREIYPFMMIALGCFYCFKKAWKHTVGLWLIGLGFSFLYFVVRPKVLGPTIQYGQGVVHTLLSEHIFYFWRALTTANIPLKNFVPLLFPLALILYWERTKERQSWRTLLHHPITAALFFISPMLLLHILANYFVHHHTIPMVVPFLSIIIFSPLPLQLRAHKRATILISIILFTFIFTSSSRYTKMVKVLASNVSQCEMSKEKKENLRAFQLFLKEKTQLYQGTENAITTSGVVPPLLAPRMQLYQITDVTKILPAFDYLIMEKKAAGDIYPLTWQEHQVIEEHCKKQASALLFENRHYLLLKGPITDACLGIRKRWPLETALLPQ
ncbi:MAG: DUF2079 domain-containing protein [Oligoflexia bacterium]|nr:DUF2079 domain-containing protein [Oligoflexia bacterium]MBF0364208.1 DUF2079 domain-containing protein [Oligoflexia bacterium]